MAGVQIPHPVYHRSPRVKQRSLRLGDWGTKSTVERQRRSPIVTLPPTPLSLVPCRMLMCTSVSQRIQYAVEFETRLSLGNIGDAASVGGGLSELKVDYGPGYRVYVMRAGNGAFVLLIGGDKRTQADDIRRARGLAAQLKEKT